MHHLRCSSGPGQPVAGTSVGNSTVSRSAPINFPFPLASGNASCASLCRRYNALSCLAALPRWLGAGSRRGAFARVPSASVQGAFASERSVAASATPSGVDSSLDSEVVYTRFSWPKNLGGEEIYTWGSFNGWSKGIKLHKFDEDCDASVIIPLKPGNYEFKFVVDNLWTPAPHEPTVTNAEGLLNNFKIVAPSISFSFKAPDAKQVLVVGDWDDFQYSILLTKNKETGVFEGQAHLKPGQYSYYFVVDQVITLNPDEPVHLGPTKEEVHKEWSYEPDLFRIFYCTGWEETVLHYRRCFPGGNKYPKGDFFRLSMVKPSSRGNKLGTWNMATVVPSSDDEYLEFYLSNGQKDGNFKEDRPGAGPLYAVPRAGSYKLIRGQMRPFPRGAESRIMVVSDIDGTMIADAMAPDAFDSSRRFLDYWESAASLAGSLLVYNTGRSLGQFVQLMRSSEGKVAVPDMLITAVGTKVWRLTESCGRSAASGIHWEEDLKWCALLDAGWNLSKARSLAMLLVNHYNDPGMIKMLDDGSEHQHRIALCADASTLGHVTSSLADGFREAGLEVRIIVSGNGSHRYVDCVPMAGGKEKALQYVRQLYGIPEYLCVAAGDSGNDVLMLEGDHPGIVVGNAQSELLNWLNTQPQDGKLVYTDACFADGILEGLARHSLY